MIENTIHQEMMSAIGNIEKPYKNEAKLIQNNTVTSPCCVVSIVLCITLLGCH